MSTPPDPKRAKVDPAPPAGGFDIAAIRAQIAARTAALKKDGASTSSPPPPAPVPVPVRTSAVRPAGPAAMPPPATMSASVAERLAAAKSRLEAMNAKSKNPYLSGSGSMPQPADPTTAIHTAQTNSSIALHPLLMGEARATTEQDKNEKRRERDRYKTMAPKFSTVKANQVANPPPGRVVVTAPAPSLNPYASTPATNSPQPEDGAPSSSRRSRKMHFSAPGKYVAQGDVVRNEAKLEALKQRIAEASKKAGLDSEFDSLERSLKVGVLVSNFGKYAHISFQRQPPPEVEWWDEAVLPPGKTYDDIEYAVQWIATDPDSLITHLIHHPIPIVAPGDRKQADRALMLTKKEQKKMRRQRRKAELEDKRDRQKMGLIPPDPPKIRMANLMKVLTSEAVADPTKIEQRVVREVHQRRIKHERDNEDRKLTNEERKTKEYDQMVNRERRGIYAAAFKSAQMTLRR